MADQTQVTFTHPHDGHEIGDKADYELVEAKRLIRAGVAVPATKPDAKKVGAEPDTAATAK